MNRPLHDLSPAQKRALIAKALSRRKRDAGQPAGEPAASIVTVPRRAPSAALRLVCFPPLAAGAAYFSGWADALAPEIEVHLVTCPGRGPLVDQACFPDLDTATEELLAALDEATTGPYALYGHSVGARLAFHLARHLDARGRPPAHLLFSASAAPDARDAFPDLTTCSEDEVSSHLAVAAWGIEPGADLRDALITCARADARLATEIRRVTCAADWRPSIPTTALAARDDRMVPTDAVLRWSAWCRGPFHLQVMPGEHHFARGAAPAVHETVRGALLGKARGERAVAGPPEPGGLDLGLFFFSCDEGDYAGDRYRLVRDTVDLADRMGLRAVWLPERHFHPVGGLFPNPSVLAAALAERTERLTIRSGSVVLALHDPIRVAEEWSVVDNLSGGRVELALVPGWNPNDFVLAPDAYEDRVAVLQGKLDCLRKLWRGEAIPRRNGVGAETTVRIHPAPVQPELTVWLTTSARDDTFVRAGELGVDVLTALLIQDVDDLARRVALYRAARERAGHDPGAGRVALMVHTYVGESEEEVRETVREPFLGYMRSVKSLWRDNVEALRGEGGDEERLLEVVFERYLQRATLFGSVDECARRVRRFRAVGVDEIACAIDFGVPYEATMGSVRRLDAVRRRFAEATATAAGGRG